MEQLKLYPIMPTAEDYDRLIETVESLGLEYQVTPEPFKVTNVTTGFKESVYLVGVVAGTADLITIMRTMHYQFV